MQYLNLNFVQFSFFDTFTKLSYNHIYKHNFLQFVVSYEPLEFKPHLKYLSYTSKNVVVLTPSLLSYLMEFHTSIFMLEVSVLR